MGALNYDNSPDMTHQETPFEVDELFFSRTDKRGVIVSGNEVFVRISGYEWQDMIGAPHKIVRHPDMPKGVFWLLWDRIKAGKVTGAYVQNRAKDGSYYWVFAVMSPVDDGYLSVRLKPTSAMLETVKEEYAALKLAETQGKVGPEESAQNLLWRLNELGYSSYDSFSAHAFLSEMEHRDSALGKRTNGVERAFADAHESLMSIRGEAQKVVEAFDTTALTAVNMRVQASRLGLIAAPLSTISENYTMLGEGIKERIERFVAASDAADRLTQGLFLTCSARLQREIESLFKQSDNQEKTEEAIRDAYLLEWLRNQYEMDAKKSLGDAATVAQDLSNSCEEMTRLLSGLSVTRILSQIECTRLGAEAEGMTEIARQLEGFQKSADTLLKKISVESRKIIVNIQKQRRA